MDNLLSIITFIPLLAAIIMLLLIRGDEDATANNIKYLALVATLATFVAALFMVFIFEPNQAGFQFVEEYEWLFGLQYKMGVDGISVLFVLLTTFLMPITVLACWNVKYRIKQFMICFLVLETFMIGVFCALDLVLFYFFFEAGLIPMFLIIGVWGGERKLYATFKFFLYTLLGSLLMLVAMIVIWADAGTTDVVKLLEYEISFVPFSILGWEVVGGLQSLLWLAFFASFCVKLPMWPFHTWLPDAHVEAPTGGSVILAAILLKLGGYGFLRFNLPMFPVGSEYFANFVVWLSVIAIIYTSLVAMMQEDMKKLIAYSSVAHMGFVTIGIFSFTHQGLEGAIFQMLSHGLISGALFLCVGVVYDQLHTRRIDDYGGLVNKMPLFALSFMFFTLANVGLPGTSGFVGEFLTLVGIFKVNTWAALFATTGVILSAAYALWLYRRVAFGPLVKASLAGVKDLSIREKLVFTPLIFMTLALGIYPRLVTDITSPAIIDLITHYLESLPQ